MKPITTSVALRCERCSLCLVLPAARVAFTADGQAHDAGPDGRALRCPFHNARLVREVRNAGDSIEQAQLAHLASLPTPPGTVALRRTDGKSCTVPIELWHRTVERGLVTQVQVTHVFDGAIALGTDPAIAVEQFLRTALAR